MSRFFIGIDIPWWSQVSVLVFFLFFLLLAFYIFSPRQKAQYEKFGKIPLDDKDE